VERRDGTVLTLRDRAFGHRTTGAATLRTAAEGKTDLLLGFAGFHRNVDEGLADTYLVPGEDPGRLAPSWSSSSATGSMERLEADPKLRWTEPHPGYAARSAFPAGTSGSRPGSPGGGWPAALLRPDNPWTAPPPTTSPPGPSPSPTGWRPTRPLRTRGELDPGDRGPSRLGQPPWRPGGATGTSSRPASAHAPALIRFLEAEGRVFGHGRHLLPRGRPLSRGTLFFPQGRNDDLDALLVESGLGGLVTPIATGLAAGGIDLGTNDQAALRLPRVLLLGGEGTASTGFGAHWHFLEQVLDLPFDIVNVGDVGSWTCRTTT
jgi:hypothetical protein